MYTIDTVPNLDCGHCKHFNVKADLPGEVSSCKRIDHKTIKFYTPWFKCYDCGMHHMICSDFEPRHPEYADFRDWEGFDEAFPVWMDAWLPYRKKTDIGFILNGDRTTVYYVPFDTFVYGPLVVDGMLQTTGKTTCARDKVDHGVQLYKRVYEKIDGVTIAGEEG